MERGARLSAPRAEPMTPARWQQIDQLLQAALERDPEHRAAFLAEACAGDDSLRREVESLLGHEAQVGSFIETPAEAVVARVMGDHQEDSLAGRMIGSWRILSLLGAGGMGQVYLAQDTKLGRKVALKLLPAGFTQDAERVRRFRLEARAASSLNHPNIITIHEIGEVGDAHFIVTEYVEGETLRAQLSHAPSNRMKLPAVLDLAAQIASALAAAHEAGIVHRDIKPENVMVRRDGYVKVLDFGLAKLMEPAAPVVDTEAPTLAVISTEAGVVMGTPRYMSPEQARGLKVDARTDIFSLGVMLYEMIAGRPPFAGETPGDVIAAILTTDPAELSQHSPEVPPELARIVAKAMKKDREERYQTVSELLADLKDLRQQPESGPGTEHLSESAATAPVTSSAEYLLGEIKRHKRVALLALTALVVAGAMIVWWLSQLINRQSVTSAPALKITRLTHTGKAVRSAVSPDGKYVVYAKDEAGRQSLWLIQVATASDEQILQPAEVSYRGITFSRDGNFIYYVRDEQHASTGTLYRKPVLGGAERKLLFNVDGPVTLSPDGSQLAFVRSTPSFREHALIIVNADGAGERKLAVSTSPRQYSFGGPAWSPDGKLIACGVLNFAEGFSANVTLVRIADGSEQSPAAWQWLMSEGRPTGTHGSRWPHLGRLAWSADGSGLFLTINEQTESEPQIWRLSWPEGEARKLTSDLSGYSDVTLTAGPDTLVAVRAEQMINLQVVPAGAAGHVSQLTSGTGRMDGVRGLGWTPDGRIVYRSLAGGDPHIWITAADGTGNKQLTSAARNNIDSAVSPDGRYILWGVNREGRFNIWRMEPDGSNVRQMTHGSGEWFPQYSPDGNWLVYRTFSPGITNALWKAPLNGGAATRLTEDIGWMPALSPDGKLIACNYRSGASARWQIALIPFEGGQPKFIEFPDPSYHRPVRWTSDGRALTYPVTRGGVSNLWVQLLDGSPPKQLTDFREQIIFNFAWSRDGRQLALSRGTVNSDVVLISNFR
jgi:serine/threonine protein kinase/Tol biopolymer transport system component